MEILAQPAVVWFLIGLVFILLELAVPGLFLLFFGIGAWLTALLTFIADIDVGLQIAIFVIASLVALLFLRRSLKRHFFASNTTSPKTLEDEFIGKRAFTISSITPSKPGRVTFKGASWNAESHQEIPAGTSVTIVGKESITLIVEPLK